MSKPSDARLTSRVRPRERRAEPHTPAPLTPAPLAAPPTARPPGQSRPRTTRFRLERVSLLPFVPAPLIAYVERARVRRRTRWIAALIVLAAVTSAVVGSMLRGPASEDDETAARPARAASPPTPTTSPRPPTRLESPPLPAPVANESQAPAEGPNALATKRSRATRKPNDDVQRSARQRPAAASSAWWW